MFGIIVFEKFLLAAVYDANIIQAFHLAGRVFVKF